VLHNVRMARNLRRKREWQVLRRKCELLFFQGLKVFEMYHFKEFLAQLGQIRSV